MKHLLLSSIALVLTALAPAQIAVLAPAALSGFKASAHGVDIRPPGAHNPYGWIHVLQSTLNTKWTYNAYYHRGYYNNSGGSGYYDLYDVDVDRQGWFAEYALPALPAGASLISAILSAKAVGLADSTGKVAASQLIRVFAYAGDGMATLADVPGSSVGVQERTTALVGPFAVDVTSKIGPLLGDRSAYAGLRVERSDYHYGNTRLPSPSFDLLSWSSPTLTLVYGYPVKAPLALGGFYGDPTKVPVAYEVRKPGTHEVVASGTVYPDAGGAVSPVVPPGTWDVSLKPSHWLRRTLKSVVVTDASSALPLASFANGDVNGDGYVTAADRALVTNALGTALGDAKYSAAADVTGDGYVTAKDRAVVTLALGTAGDD